ncbi:hypothetical protein IWW55_000935 [Coemansia sp. RSA 2706]|nr:hypothetical protein LPJ63_005101 [Coemansia sp. RSA 2711]KAJ2307503.1 hypothetical protein IWW55_000935 [Coemansia sp. RSA 2706]KAJ2319958.1 hypothetical protein IWW52_001664 [Coemansia sp. RSA 2704]KAJ2329408.1 hypothetical protein IWW51_000621 [Coemansia sp. RSA 2702]KAJ2382654.1 hypothetical protein H4S02_005655 [Coemansia sp. RSA 2611]KAJ2737867.1 hypothetical protein H4R23_001544 [Coemansia sp. Cherry 401B]
MFEVYSDSVYETRVSSAHKMATLKRANSVLEQPLICLSRIREPLAFVGGYWNMDPEIVFKVTAGSLYTVVEAIEQMREFFAGLFGSVELSQEARACIKVFLDRASAWVRANRIDDCIVYKMPVEDEGVEVSSQHYDWC